jgi:iron complex transport system substrate-binding protein
MKSIFLTVVAVLFMSTLWAQAPQRIVSLAPSLTKGVYYLGADEALVGHTSYCFIAKDDGKEVVASAIKVNVEKVLMLNPDLVLVHSITKPQTIDMLRKAGLKVEVFETPRSFDEICTQFLRLGRLIGKEDTAREMVASITKDVNRIRQKYDSSQPQKFFFQIGADPLFTVLDNTYMADFISFSGGTNISSGLKIGPVSREFVLMKNPDVIIIVNMGIVGDEEMKIWQSYPDLNAVKSGKLFFIESDMASTPNPVDFLQTMQVIESKLNNCKSVAGKL